MRTIKIGSRGADVKTLQRRLGVAVDGVFGRETKAALVTWQSARGLEADGIVGPISWAALLAEAVPAHPVDYKQYDARWGSLRYSTHTDKQTIRSSGCGPTAMANIVATWFDPEITPKELCALAVERGYRTRGTGTAWGFFDCMAARYEFSGYRRTSSHAEAMNALSKGALIVASMGPGYWTRAGHFITLWKYDGTFVYAKDPASAKRTKQKLAAFKKQVKKYFVFLPPLGWGDAPEEPEAPEMPVQPPTPTPVGGIYDVSKWQGKIDWPRVKASGKMGLVILRAGYGQESEDARFQYNARACAKHGIPFGVYWYSYATDAERAVKEARSFHRVASPFKPLFYVLDAEEGCLRGATIDAFLREIRLRTGGKIGAYIANHRFSSYKADTDLADFIWIPRGNRIQPTHRPLDLWQYSFGSKVPGISGNVDQNKIPDCGRYGMAWFLGRE